MKPYFYNLRSVATQAASSLLLLAGAEASDPELTLESGIFYAANGLPGDSFSNSMGVDGGTAVVGAYERLTPSSRGKGSAYIFDRQPDGAWKQAAYLTGTETVGLFRYGYSVDISGDTAVVGTKDTLLPFRGSGVVFVHERNKGGDNQWGEVKMLEASDASAVDQFGASVAIEGDTIIVGAIGASHVTNTDGAAYVFYRDHGGPDNWGEVKKLTASNAASGDQFGFSVAVDGDVAVVGANLGDKTPTAWDEWDVGSAYVFERHQGGTDNWGETAYLIAPDYAKGDWFGRSVAVNGDTAIIGANQKTESAVRAGAAYIFSRSSVGGPWELTQKLSGEGNAHDNFGGSVDIDGGFAVVGEWLGDGAQPDTGIVHVYQKNAPGSSEAWTAVRRLAPSQTIGGFFGRSVAVMGDTFLAGSELATGAKGSTGAVFVYQDTPEPGPKLSVTSITRDEGTGSVTLEWTPPISNGSIERSRDLIQWETLADAISGSAWSGAIPGSPNENYVRVRAMTEAAQ